MKTFKQFLLQENYTSLNKEVTIHVNPTPETMRGIVQQTIQNHLETLNNSPSEPSYYYPSIRGFYHPDHGLILVTGKGDILHQHAINQAQQNDPNLYKTLTDPRIQHVEFTDTKPFNPTQHNERNIRNLVNEFLDLHGPRLPM